MAENKKPRKPGSGGARRTVDPDKGKSQIYNVSLYQAERDKLVEKYGSLTKAVRSLLLTK